MFGSNFVDLGYCLLEVSWFSISILVLYKRSHCVLSYLFCSLPSRLICIISRGYKQYNFYLIFSVAMNYLLSKNFLHVQIIDFYFLMRVHMTTTGRQQEKMVQISVQREIYLQNDWYIYFSYCSFNFSCFEHANFLHAPIWALRFQTPTCFLEVIFPK